MKLVTFEHEGDARVGALRETDVVDLRSAWGTGDPAPLSLVSLLQGGPAAMARARAVAEAAPAAARRPLASVRLLSPLPRPSKVLCVGLNYRDHAEETGQPIPKVPIFFTKAVTSVIGPGAPIVLPLDSEQVDYEAELAVVMGARCRRVSPDAARDAIAGYTIMNDVSARDWQFRTSQWFIGKTFDTFAPLGPAVVTGDEVGDPHVLDVSLRVNGTEMQRSNTRHLIFGVPDLIAELSRVMTLEPGDVIATGTPGGVGFIRKPPVFLRPGDRVEITIARVGTLTNPVAAEGRA
jgi:2-keto-4-pentenoate hydratase/2-oxohepta-3-ene-1,7-dioic acid hydratase in catechol pathway